MSRQIGDVHRRLPTESESGGIAAEEVQRSSGSMLSPDGSRWVALRLEAFGTEYMLLWGHFIMVSLSSPRLFLSTSPSLAKEGEKLQHLTSYIML